MAKSLRRKNLAGKETQNIRRFEKMLTDHYNGNPWIDITIAGELKSVSAKNASQNIGELNSIWQITRHMISWRNALIARVMDSPHPHPNNNFIEEIRDTSSKAWKDTLRKFARSQKDIISFLKTQEDMLLEKVSLASGYSYFELVNAILIHDSYHLGQIVLIKKLLKK